MTSALPPASPRHPLYLAAAPLEKLPLFQDSDKAGSAKNTDDFADPAGLWASVVFTAKSPPGSETRRKRGAVGLGVDDNVQQLVRLVLDDTFAGFQFDQSADPTRDPDDDDPPIAKPFELNSLFDNDQPADESDYVYVKGTNVRSKQSVYVPPCQTAVKRTKNNRPDHNAREDDDDDFLEPQSADPASPNAVPLVLPEGGALSLIRDLKLELDPPSSSLESKLLNEISALGLHISDLDPSALRSNIRTALDTKQAKLASALVGLHAIKVAAALAQDMPHLSAFVEYVHDATNGYTSVMQDWAQPVLSHLDSCVEMAMSLNMQTLDDHTKSSTSAATSLKVKRIETTIAVDQAQVCSDAALRSLVHALESSFQVRVVERDLGVSMLLDAKNASAIVALSSETSTTELQSTTNALVKWLACEAHRLVQFIKLKTNHFILHVPSTGGLIRLANNSTCKRIGFGWCSFCAKKLALAHALWYDQ